MPTYCYESIKSCKICKGFEVNQSIHDEALSNCPTCNKKCKRIIQPVNITGIAGSRVQDNAKKLGFQTFKRKSQGQYERI